MFWRFGFHNASTVDSLLDKEDVALEAILDQDDLLQECKAQNTRLIDYFQRVDVLQRLFGYVTGQIEGDEGGRFKYPYVATEVLCSDIWSIVETCLDRRQQILAPFWETVLDMSVEEMKTHLVMATHFSKITSLYLAKKPAEMLEFLKSLPNVLEKLLKHIGNPSFVDVLVRIIQLDEIPGGEGVLEWLHSEGLISRLIDLLSPSNPSDIQQIASELLVAIISMATPSPGAAITEQGPHGVASNLYAREIARPEYISRLIILIFQDFASDRNPSLADEEEDMDPSKRDLPKFEYASSSAVLAMHVVSELIRKNNSDYFEPFLFHTLRHRLTTVQQQQMQEHVQGDSEECREALERAMKEMVDRMGVVNLNYLLDILSDRMETLMHYLESPRSWRGLEPTTVGTVMPLTFERLRIVEMFAEMLHCSNMSLLNRSPTFDHLYDNSGRLQGGLSAMKDLGIVSEPQINNQDEDMTEDDMNQVEPALEFPVSATSHDSSSLLDSDDDMSSDDDDDDDDEPGSSDDDAMEEIIMTDEPTTQTQTQDSPLENRPENSMDNATPDQSRPESHRSSSVGHRSVGSRRSSRRMTLQGDTPSGPLLFVGEKLKKKFLDLNVPCRLLDLFFEYPWNNFLHSAVFDVLSQMMSGPVDTSSGWNRELVISVFRDAQVMHRLVDAHKQNEESIAKPKGLRLGYMAHLHRLTETILDCLSRYPPELRLLLIQYAPDPGWDQYITSTFNKTRDDNSKLLGGGRPAISSAPVGVGGAKVSRWKVDEEDPTGNTLTTATTPAADSEAEVRVEFRRSRPTKPQTADFGPSSMDDFDEDDEEDDDENEDDGHDPAPHFTRYMARQMNSGTMDNGSSEDEDDDEGGWLSQSTFTLGNPPAISGLERRPLETNGFGDVFDPTGQGQGQSTTTDPFASDEDEFGPFSDTTGSDPFTFPTSFSEEMDDSTFVESFGDFQSASPPPPLQDGELTPTAGSWTFASSDASSVSDDTGSDRSEPESPEEEKRMPDKK